MPLPKPTISVVIPAYNRAHLIQETIDSVLAQTLAPLEILVVDDGSTDSTLEALTVYGERIRVISRENGGSAAARNTGVAAARGTWIALLDSDDRWLPEKLEYQMAVSAQFPEAPFIHSDALPMTAEGEPVPNSYNEGTAPDVYEGSLEPDSLERLMRTAYPLPSGTLITRAAYREIGGFNTRWRWDEEWHFFLRVAAKYPFVSTRRRLVYYRQHPTSKTFDSFRFYIYKVQLRRYIEARKAAWLREYRSPETLKQALRDHTWRFAHAWYRLGKAYSRQGDAAAARDAFQEAMRIAPPVTTARYFPFWLAAAARARGSQSPEVPDLLRFELTTEGEMTA